ncbi:MAG: copper resistance protein CopC/CopD [Acidimicrobiales bacterium]|nr:copper resistance protein CopC/CopD [Acidimicrobiales bacterium]
MPRPIHHPVTSTVDRADAGLRNATSGQAGSARRVHAAVLILLVVLAVVGGWAGRASAHAALESSDPVDGSVLDAGPTAVKMTFTEGVEVRADGVRVLDAAGERVDAGRATASGTTVTAPLRSGLVDGGYVVAWRVVSADGHPVSGAFRFSIGVRSEVGADVAERAFASASDDRDEWAGRALRALTYLAVLGVSGAVVVGGGLRREDEPTPVNRAVGALAGVGIFAAAAQIPFQASLVSGQGLGSVSDQGVLKLALSDGFGWSILAVCLGLLSVALTTGLPFRAAVRVTATGGAVLAPLGLVVTGHTRTMSPAALGYLADLIHVFAGAVWFGGLLSLVATLRRRRRVADLPAAADAVRRFSGWALVTAALVVASGSTLAWIEVRGLHALVDTSYGRVLVAKVSLVGVVLLGAAWNRFSFIPSLGGSDEAAGSEDADDADDSGDGAQDSSPGAGDATTVSGKWPTFHKVLRTEVALLAVVLVLTGVLSNLTPAREVAASAAVEISASAPFGNGRVDVSFDPGREGRNDVHVQFFDSKGLADDSYEDVEVHLSLPAKDVGPLDLEPATAGPGHFIVVNTDVPLAGTWTVEVTAQRDRFTQVEASVRITVR